MRPRSIPSDERIEAEIDCMREYHMFKQQQKKVIHEIAVDKSYWLWQTWKKKKNNKIVEMINWRLCGYNRWKLYPTTYTQTQSNQPKHLLDNRHFFAGSISGSLPLLWPLQTSQFYRKIHSSKIWTDSFNIDNR